MWMNAGAQGGEYELRHGYQDSAAALVADAQNLLPICNSVSKVMEKPGGGGLDTDR